MRSLSVLLLTSLSGPFGTEQCFADLAEGLQERGHHVVAVAPKTGWLGDHLISRDIETARFQLRLHSPVSYGHLARLAVKHRPNIVHAHSARATRFAQLMGKWLNIPFVTTLHHSQPGTAYVSAAQAGGIVVGVSEHVSSILSKSGVPGDRVRVIYAGTHIAESTPAPRDSALLESLGVPPDRFVFGVVGRFTPDKGQWLALEAMARLPVEVRRATHLLCVGGREENRFAKLRSQADALGLGSQVALLGIRNDVARLLCSMDAVLLPSSTEGMPLSVLEAMCMGRPVAATPVGDLPLVIRDGENGLLFDRDPNALAQVMLKLAGDRSFCSAIGAQARIDAASRFSHRRMAAEHADLYEELVAVSALTSLAQA